MTNLMSLHGWLAVASFLALGVLGLRMAYGLFAKRKLVLGQFEVLAAFAVPASVALFLHWIIDRAIVFEHTFEGTVIALASSEDGTIIAAADTLGVVKTFDLVKQAQLGGIPVSDVSALMITKTSDGKSIVEIMQSDGTMASAGTDLAELASSSLPTAVEFVLAARFGDEDITIHKTPVSRAGREFYDITISNGREAFEINGELDIRPTAAARFTPPGTSPQYALGLADGRMAVIDLNKPQRERIRISAVEEGRKDPVALIATASGGFAAAEGPIIASVDTKGQFSAWSIGVKSGEPVLLDSFRGAASGNTIPGVVTVLKGHENSVSSAAFSPDGTKLVTASYDGTARLWDRTGNELAKMMGHQDGIVSASFSPDGTKILTAGIDGTSRIWDAAGKELVVLKGHQNTVWSAAFSPDGSRIVTASADGTARQWDLAGRELAMIKVLEGDVIRAAFSPDGNRIVTASADDIARLWNVAGDKLAELRGHGGDVNSASFNAEGTRILTASADNTARLWNLAGKELAVLKGHPRTVFSAMFSPDDRRILTASNDRTVRLWDASGRELAVLNGHSADVNSAAFAPDGKMIVTASTDRTARIWNLDHIANSGCLGCLAINIDTTGETIELIDYTGRHQLFATATGLKISETEGTLKGQGYAFADGSLLDTAEDGAAALDDNTRLTPHDDIVTAALLLPDGRIVTGAADGDLRVLDPRMHSLMGMIDIWPHAAALIAYLTPAASPTPATGGLPDPLPEAFVVGLAFTKAQEGGFPGRSDAEVTKDLYSTYWLPAGCDALPGDLARIHFDTAVNSGVNTANQFLAQISANQQVQAGPELRPAAYLDLRRDWIRSRPNLTPAMRNALIRRLDALAQNVGIAWSADPASAN